MTDYIQVLTTINDRQQADEIARGLVEDRLAACVQVLGPIQSHYQWQGKLETAQEWLLLAKSRRDQYPALEQAIREKHPYEVPEILALAVEAGSAAYLGWIDRELGATA